ncbi:hypothetical protein O3P69_000759 [Scylla paramamosain]|uniref:Phosphatidylinositol-specific phospholipase C X domain-containing protein n=1 Tax=Scylla paramamosain TaxID=85552 RepID=A0AAW0US65_SCYPA
MGDEKFTEQASTDSLWQSGDLKGLASHDSLTRKEGGEPLFFRIEDALRRQAAEGSGKELTGPLVSRSDRPASVSTFEGVKDCGTKQRRCFPFPWKAREVKSKESQENGHPRPKTHFAATPTLENPSNDLSMQVSGEGRKRPTSNIGAWLVSESNDICQLDLTLAHNARSNHDKAVGDFTSVTFELEDFSDIEENNEIPGSALSLPNTQEADTKLQEARPFISKEDSLFVTSHSLGHHLPPLEKQVVLDSEIITNSSLNLESWMSRLPRVLQQLPLNHLYIPGSHDSFSYSLNPESEVAPDAPDPVKGLMRVVPCLARPALLRWSVTQRTTVTEQLRHGVRYFDIRVAARGSKFYFVHGLFGADLQPLLSEVRLFLAQHPGEVVLLDFQHFHGLEMDDHAALIALLRSTFATTLCPVFTYLQNLNLDILARLKHQVLVFYRHAAGEDAASWLWPSETLPNPWPAAVTVSSMLRFLRARLAARDPDTFFVTQCVLTPTGSYLARRLCGNLEANLAIPTNQVLPDWVKGLPSGTPGANIVMVDFVEHNSWEVPRAVINKNMEALLPAPAKFKAQHTM